MKELPAISVIIPLYNAEKYVGECLESLLAQTFPNFEVIVVDDCSTDASVEVVKNYAPKFNGRLRIAHMNKNSGGAGFPRNKGINLARGEYIYCMDADDAITPTALEEMWSLAKDFDADVVACEKFYSVNDNDNPKIKLIVGRKSETIIEPTLITENIAERINLFQQSHFIFSAVLKLIRREFFIENEIKFPDCFAEDVVVTIFLLCCAKRYVVAPNTFYYYRQHESSTLHSQYELSQRFHRQIKALKTGFRYIDEFLNDREFFWQRPDLKYILFESFAREMLNYLIKFYRQVPIFDLDNLLREEFRDGNNLALTAFIFSMMNVYRLQLLDNLSRLSDLEKIEQQYKTYISELEKFAVQSQRRLVELETEISRLKSKE